MLIKGLEITAEHSFRHWKPREEEGGGKGDGF
jgi:hypothetical protein